eukprot:Skav222826  [mRNA]  locus=scaffold4760:65880:67188:+ [translate_table: standard]
MDVEGYLRRAGGDLGVLQGYLEMQFEKQTLLLSDLAMALRHPRSDVARMTTATQLGRHGGGGWWRLMVGEHRDSGRASLVRHATLERHVQAQQAAKRIEIARRRTRNQTLIEQQKDQSYRAVARRPLELPRCDCS